MKRTRIEQTLHLLNTEYGYREWQPNQDPISTLVQTILSQNTSDRNSHRAFASLTASFRSWSNIASASLSQIADSIKTGGLAEIKAKYIKQSFEEIKHRRGELRLDFLKQLTADEARDWLMQLPGIGMKTASCVLLFSLGMPAFPVDTHIFRIARRLNLLDAKTTVDKAHRILESIVPQDSIYSLHVLLIEHGRKICKAQRPHCHQCVLQEICPSYDKLNNFD